MKNRLIFNICKSNCSSALDGYRDQILTGIEHFIQSLSNLPEIDYVTINVEGVANFLRSVKNCIGSRSPIRKYAVYTFIESRGLN